MVVRVEDGRIILVDGHHRLTAILQLIAEGVEILRIDARQFRGNDAERIAHMLTSAQGKPLTPLEQGLQYRKLIGFGWTTQEVASKVGKSANYVSQMLTLAESNSDVQGMVTRKEVAAHVALEVVKKHGSGAGKVLAGHLETARSAGKTKVTKKTVKQLRTMFDQAPINSVTPQHIAQYRDARSAKVRANREIAMFSHIFNMAREWGYTKNENPCRGVRKNKEEPRDYYADAPVWDAVYAVACIELQDAMDLAYLTGQRPADTLRMLKPHIQGGFLEVKQGKTKKKLRIILERTERRSELGELLDRIIGRDVQCRTQHLICTPEGEPLKKWTLRTRFDNARAAAERATSDGNDYLAGRIREFQFRDIRPKAASEIESLTDASKLLGHTEEEITRQVYRRVGEKVKPTR